MVQKKKNTEATKEHQKMHSKRILLIIGNTKDAINTFIYKQTIHISISIRKVTRIFSNVFLFCHLPNRNRDINLRYAKMVFKFNHYSNAIKPTT